MLYRALPIVFALSLSAQGQLYIHDARREADARQASKSFSEATNKDSGAFAAMLANLDAVHERNLVELRELTETTRAAFLNRLPFMTWAQFTSRIREKQTEFADLRQDSLKRIAEIRAAMKVASAASADLAQQLKDLEAELDTRKAALAEARPTLRQFENEIDKLKLDGVQPNLEGLKKVAGAATALKRLSELVDSLMQKPPGLQLVMLDLAVGLQRAELDREQATIIHLQNQLRLENARVRDLLRVTGLGLRDANKDLIGPGFGMILTQATAADPNELVFARVAALAAGASGQPGTLLASAAAPQRPVLSRLDYTRELRNVIDTLQQATAIYGFESYLKDAAALERAYQEQRHALRLSAINARQREVLVAHGLQGLEQYYSGGWKAEDTANLFRALQTIAQGAIGVRLR